MVVFGQLLPPFQKRPQFGNLLNKRGWRKIVQAAKSQCHVQGTLATGDQIGHLDSQLDFPAGQQAVEVVAVDGHELARFQRKVRSLLPAAKVTQDTNDEWQFRTRNNPFAVAFISDVAARFAHAAELLPQG